MAAGVEAKTQTFKEFRDAAKNNQGVFMVGWMATDSASPLIRPFQEMADDIQKWFRPEQGWKLTELRIGFANNKRFDEAWEMGIIEHDLLRTTLGNKDKTQALIELLEDLGTAGKIRDEEPDKLMSFFTFEAEHPPLKKGWLRKTPEFDFPKVFAPNFRDKIEWWKMGGNGIDAPVDSIGPVHILEQALAELTSPYYLVGANIAAKSREHIPTTVYEARAQAGKQLEPSRDLVVTVYMDDLDDYMKLEINKLRRGRSRLTKLI